MNTPPAGRQDWPQPVEVLNLDGNSDIVLICEHASNHIPASFNDLGLPPEELTRHIAWDIGAASVTRSLSAMLDAPCFLGTYSRLLIDLNRPVGSSTSIPSRSEATDIPGNTTLGTDDRRRRIETIFDPFQSAISDYLDKRRQQGRATKIVAIHSFTPVFMGESRPWHAGILFNQSVTLGHNIIDQLSRITGLTIGANVPYVIERMSDYAIPVHGEERGLDAVLVEIRQDLIASAGGQAQWARYLHEALREPE